MHMPVLGFVVAALVASFGCAPVGGPTSTIPAATTAPSPPPTMMSITPGAATVLPATAGTLTMAPAAITSPASVPPTAASPAPTSSPDARVTVLPTPALSAGRQMGQTRIRFSVGDAEIIVRTADNPTSRDFLSMLPLTLNFRDFNAMEKIGDLPRRLATEGSTGGAPANGDLIYFVPWGNLGFFYDAARRDASFDDRVIQIGTVEAGYGRLGELEAGPVLVELIP